MRGADISNADAYGFHDVDGVETTGFDVRVIAADDEIYFRLLIAVSFRPPEPIWLDKSK